MLQLLTHRRRLARARRRVRSTLCTTVATRLSPWKEGYGVFRHRYVSIYYTILYQKNSRHPQSYRVFGRKLHEMVRSQFIFVMQFNSFPFFQELHRLALNVKRFTSLICSRSRYSRNAPRLRHSSFAILWANTVAEMITPYIYPVIFAIVTKASASPQNATSYNDIQLAIDRSLIQSYKPEHSTS